MSSLLNITWMIKSRKDEMRGT